MARIWNRQRGTSRELCGRVLKGLISAGAADEPFKKSDGVNVLGLSSVYLRGKADAIEIRRLLELCDIHVVSMPGVGDSWESIMKAPEAALNIVVRNELALKAAEDMKSRFDIPYISVGLPYGMEGTLRWLNRIAEAVNSASLKAAEMEIRCRQKRLLHFGNNMKSMWGTLWFDRILFRHHRKRVWELQKRCGGNGRTQKI